MVGGPVAVEIGQRVIDLPVAVEVETDCVEDAVTVRVDIPLPDQMVADPSPSPRQ